MEKNTGLIGDGTAFGALVAAVRDLRQAESLGSRPGCG